MKVLSIEGIKGTGKSTIVTKIQENYFIRKIEKFTKGINNLPYFLTVFREEHKDYFYNADSSLALGFYANFFNRLAEIRESEIVIFAPVGKSMKSSAFKTEPPETSKSIGSSFFS